MKNNVVSATGISLCMFVIGGQAEVLVIDETTPLAGEYHYAPSDKSGNSVYAKNIDRQGFNIYGGVDGYNYVDLIGSVFNGVTITNSGTLGVAPDQVYGAGGNFNNSTLNSIVGVYKYSDGQAVVLSGLDISVVGSNVSNFSAFYGFSSLSALSNDNRINISGSVLDRVKVFQGDAIGLPNGMDVSIVDSDINYFIMNDYIGGMYGLDLPVSIKYSSVSVEGGRVGEIIAAATTQDSDSQFVGFNEINLRNVAFDFAYAGAFGVRYGGAGNSIMQGNAIGVYNSPLAGSFAAASTDVWATYGVAIDNTALVSNSTFVQAGSVYGAFTEASRNEIYVVGSIGQTVAAVAKLNDTLSYASSYTGLAYDNSLRIDESSISGFVYGAQGVSAHSNMVYVRNSTIGSIVGSEAESGDAINNTVHLYGATQVAQNVYGGLSLSAGDALTGNALFIEPTIGSVFVGGDVSNFSEINIDFSDAQVVNNAPSALVATGAVDLQFGSSFTQVNLAGVSAQYGRLNLITAGSLLNYNPAWIGSSPVTYDFISLSTGVDNSQAPTSTLYVDYGLSWFKNDFSAHGTFTLNDDDQFALEVDLVDQVVVPNNVAGWDGKTLTKKGSGILILEGENTYTGGTYIEAGTLQIGDGDFSGSILGAVLNDGVLSINRSDAVVLDNLISGSGAVAVLGDGSVELAKDNSYSGGTHIEEGTLIVSNLASIGSGVVRNESNLLIRAASGDWINPISGELGDVNVTNNSNVRMLAAVEAHRLTVEDGSQVSIADGQSWLVSNLDNDGILTLGDNTRVVTRLVNNSLLQLRGGSAVSARIEGDVINQGQIRIGQETGGNRLTVDGDYLGENASLLLDAVLAADDSVTDRFIITGKAYGATAVVVRNLDGEGAETDLGIRIIDTASSESNAFYLPGGYVGAGAYDYQLVSREEADGDNWYLSNRLNNTDEPLYNPSLGSIFANQSAANNLFNLRYETREGAGQTRGASKLEDRLWVRFDATKNRFHSMSSQLKTKGNSAVTQIGMSLTEGLTDMPFEAGVLAGYAQFDSSTHASASERKSSSSVKGYSVGAYATWYANPEQPRGLYVDSWLMWNSFDNQLKTPDGDKHSYDSSGISASIEVGKDFSLGPIGNAGIWLQPQAQLIYQGVRADKYRGENGLTIKNGRDNVQLRTGVKAYADNLTVGAVQAHPFIALNYIHNTNPYSVKINHETMRNQGGKNLGEVKLGLESQFNNAQLWFDTSYTQGSHGHKDYGLNVGFKYPF